MHALIDRCRGAALLAAPLALVSLALMITAEVSSSDMGTAMGSGLGSAGAIIGLLSVIALFLGLLGLHLARIDALGSRATVPAMAMLTGAVLAAGGMWDQVFVMPVLADLAPQLLTEPHAAVLAGYLISYGVLGLGALIWAIIARRAGELTRPVSWMLIAGGVLCLTPLPNRFFLLAIAVTVEAARRVHAAAPAVLSS